MTTVILARKSATPEQRYAHGAEIVGTDQMDFHRRALVWWRLRLTFDDKGGLPIVAAKGQTRSDTHRLHAGQGAEFLQQSLVEIDLLLFFFIFLLRQIEAEAQHAFVGETGVDLVQTVKTPQQQ